MIKKAAKKVLKVSKKKVPKDKNKLFTVFFEDTLLCRGGVEILAKTKEEAEEKFLNEEFDPLEIFDGEQEITNTKVVSVSILK